VFLKSISSFFLLLMCTLAFNAVCAASPLMVEKNLFSTDRKPPSPESLDASSKPVRPGVALGNIQLEGVIIHSSEKRAVLRMKSQSVGPPGRKGSSPSPFVTVREGQMVSDYRVSKIEPKSISLEKDGQTFTVNLFAENKVLSPIAPQPPPVQTQPAAMPPGGAQQDVDNEHPAGVQTEPGANQQNPRQAVPGQGRAGPPNLGGGRNRNQAANPNAQQNAQDPAADQGMQDPNQPAETVEEE
jgi:hypothetical protein